MTGSSINRTLSIVIAAVIALGALLLVLVVTMSMLPDEPDNAATPQSPHSTGGLRLRAGVEADPTREIIFSNIDATDLQVPRESLTARFGYDAVEALNSPMGQRTADVDVLDPDTPVIVIRHDDAALAYPLDLVAAHIIANDLVGGLPILIVHWPPAGTLAVFDRRLDIEDDEESGDAPFNFALTGLVHNETAIIIHDRSFDALWEPLAARGISSRASGVGMRTLPFETTTFEEYRRQHPDGEIVTLGVGSTFDASDLATPDGLGFAIIDAQDSVGFVDDDALPTGEHRIQLPAGTIILRRTSSGWAVASMDAGVDVRVFRTSRAALEQVHDEVTTLTPAPR